MQITLPDDLSVRLHQLAAQHQQPFEQYVADHLRLTLDDESPAYGEYKTKVGQSRFAPT